LQQLIIRFGCRTGLDVGCGENSPLAPMRQYGLWVVGVDASPEVIRKAQQRNLFDEYTCEDLRSYLRGLGKGFDVVIASHVIEHLDRDQGMEFLRALELTGRQLVYVETPHGFQPQAAWDGNPFQRHLSGWFPWDFEARGYTVFGSGIRGLRGAEGRGALLGEFLTRSVDRGFQWLSYAHPWCAGTLAAIRCMDQDGNVRRL
jgi:SAM-dependent methyltransferase